MRWILSVGTIGIAVLLCLPATAGAVDGGVDVRSDHQSGELGGEVFSTNATRQTIFLRQMAPLSKRVLLDFDARWVRDFAGSDLGGASQETDRQSARGGLDFSYRTRPFAAGIQADWLRERRPGTAPRLDRSDYSGWLKLKPGERTGFQANLTRRSSRTERSGAADAESREFNAFVSSDYRSRIGQFRYRFTGITTDALSRDLRQTQLAHILEYGGSRRFAGDRVDASLRVLSSFLDQEVEAGRASEGRILLIPFTGGVYPDDTPEVHDPLEDPLIPVPTLYDRDRETPTQINLGDSAPVVREFGGDYRNLQYDFGEVRDLNSAVLYVDTRLLLPELFQWRVFVTEDPEGSIWNELEADSAVVQYREWDTGLQGWEITFPAGASTRYLKLVDVKIGVTVPNLLVTELEVYSPTTTEVRTTKSAFRDHRVNADIGYRPTQKLYFGYKATLRERDQRTGGGGNLSERNHGFSSRWKSGTYALVGQYQTTTISSIGGRNTDYRLYELSASRGVGTRLSSQLSWNRSEDRSQGRDRTTSTQSLALNWRAAPRLRFTQRVSYGQRQEPAQGPSSDSIVMVTSVNGSPFTTVNIAVNRSDRWVSREAGSGFQAFNDTGIQVHWSPLPSVTFSGQANYQVRMESEWNARTFVSWVPFLGRKVNLRVSGNNFYDSRIDASERGITVALKWKAHPRLLVDGSVGVQRFDRAGEENSPVSTTLHAAWSF